ncbi:MAG: RusA family crossover junction endodeoxyribonuclease [Oscillospiraceae bacterium]|jgi:Holliday junction resolvase RusA-like endonuclease|nr:RusA family crossover junction endodeoxyribonuclease [Oscillospiraceae bacterium]
MKIKFTILGEPFGKERPRFSVKGFKVFTYTPAKTSNYEKTIRKEFREKVGVSFKEKIPLEVKITAYYRIPKHTPKDWVRKMNARLILPTKKPDLDNVVKVIFDALNGVCYYDDVQVCKLNIEKFYSTDPRVEVEIEDMEVLKNASL